MIIESWILIDFLCSRFIAFVIDIFFSHHLEIDFTHKLNRRSQSRRASVGDLVHNSRKSTAKDPLDGPESATLARLIATR